MQRYFTEMDKAALNEADITQSQLNNASSEISQICQSYWIVSDLVKQMAHSSLDSPLTNATIYKTFFNNFYYNFHLSLYWHSFESNNQENYIVEEFLCIKLELQSTDSNNVTVGWKISIIDCHQLKSETKGGKMFLKITVILH